MATYTLTEVLDDKPTGKKYNLSEVVEQPSRLGKLSDIPRQLGLTGRYLIESGADTVGLFSDPISALMNLGGANTVPAGTLGRRAADYIGLPSPETPVERMVADASRMLAPTGGIIKGAQVASNAVGPTSKAVLNTMASRPGSQAAAATGAGLAGGYAREEGAGPGGQFAASLAGGVSLPMVTNAVQRGAQSVGRYAQSIAAPQTVNIRIENAIRQAGITLDELPAQVQQSIRADVGQALNTGGTLSPDAVRRLADYRLTGLTPLRSSLTLNPAEVTRERNLAKIGANSRDPAAQQLSLVQNENNARLIGNLNNLGADAATDAYAAGQRIIGTLDNRNNTVKGVINNLYQNARDTQGRSANLDPSVFTNRANNLLDDALVGGKLPDDVRGLLNKTAAGQMPLTVDVAEQLKTRIGDLQRASMDGAERKALSLVRQALDETPLIDNQQLGAESIKAFNSARGVNRKWMQVVEKTPALQAVRDGIEPDKFVQQFIIGNGSKSTVMDVSSLKNQIKSSKEAMEAVRGQLLSHLKGRALNGAADEVGNFSPAAYNKAIADIGERKLAMFFNKEELAQLKALGRVASYEQFQPKGSAVNNSNTAAAAFSALIDRVANSSVVRKIPFGAAVISNPAQDVTLSLGARNALNAPSALAFKPPAQNVPPWPLLMAPGLLTTE